MAMLVLSKSVAGQLKTPAGYEIRDDGSKRLGVYGPTGTYLHAFQDVKYTG
jgi:hypothetical protein